MGSSREGTRSEGSPLLAASQAGLAVQLVVQLVVGLILSFRYAADPGHAYADVSAMHRDALFGFLQGLHYWGSALLILHSTLHLFAATWAGAYGKGGRGFYFASLLFFLCSLGFQLTGNVLPFDRHGVQTANVEAGIAARAPVVGARVARLLMGGGSFNDATLERWYLLHRFVLPVLALMALVAFYASRRNLAAKWTAFVPVAVALVAALAVKAPLGNIAAQADYDQSAAHVSWYMWPLHGTMHMVERLGTSLGWVGAILVPTLFVAFLFLLALAGNRISLKVARGVLGVMALVLAVGALGFGGSFAPLTGSRDPAPVATTTPGTRVSPIDAALAQRGRDAFNKNPCADCHGKDGAQGGGGPVLTRVWQRHPDADYYIRYIRNPSAVQPSSTMPAFPKLPDDDVKAIAEYLRSKK